MSELKSKGRHRNLEKNEQLCLAVVDSEDGGVVHATTCLLACVCGTGPYQGGGPIAPGRYT